MLQFSNDPIDFGWSARIRRWASRSFVLALSLTLVAESASAGRVIASVPRPDPELFKKAQSLAAEAKTDAAAKVLSEQIKKETDKDKRALSRMALAVILFQASRDAEAETQFKQAIDDGTRIDDYANYYLGLLYKKGGKNKEARAAFEKVLGSSAPSQTETEARFQIADTYAGEKNWKGALSEYQKLQRKMRREPEYPEVLFNLVRAEKHLGKRGGGCKWARELYSKYPTYAAIREWGPELPSNTIDGMKLGCSAGPRELKTRIRRLQLGGEAERASQELRGLQKEIAAQEGSYSVDSMLANHLISEGMTDEAMKLLLKHYKTQGSRPAYLLLMAKAASRAGDYQAAVGFYMKAYETAPRAHRSATSLFQAAFTSYQFQDYDGASRKFEQFVKAFPRSKLARDSEWYLAWIRYLRGDYMGAYQNFVKLSAAPKMVIRRGRRRIVVRTEAVATDRIRYWMAMSLLKMGRQSEAVPLFQSLVRDPAIGYYAVLSYYRLTSIPGAKLPSGIETRLGLKKSSEKDGTVPTEEDMQIANEAVADSQAEFQSEEEEQTAAADDGSDTDEEENAESADSDEDEGSAVAEDASAGEDKIAPVGFHDPVLARRFERARDLNSIGLTEPARRELMEIERRARSRDDRRLLITEYQQVRNYYRSSYMGEIGFSSIRLQGGLKGDSRQYWEYAYPRAFEPAVLEASSSTTVPEELIWGIMRAESHFRQDAQSPVGALGLMQLMPFTGRQVASLLNMNGFEPLSLLVPETNIRLGSRYLQRLLEKFSGSVPLVAAGYNAGPHRVHAWVRNFGQLDMDEFIDHIPFVETRNYVKRVVRNYQIYSLLYSGGSHSLKWLVQPVGVKLSEDVPTREIW